MNLKTLLVNPPFTLEQRYGKRMKSFGAVTEPLGLCYLAANLEASHCVVEIIDGQAEDLHNEDIIAKVNEGGFALVGISFMTPMFDDVKELTDAIKNACHDVKIIIGGPHSTALPQKTLEEMPSVDFSCVGEGEHVIVDIVKHLNGELPAKQINGISFRDNNGTIVNNPARKGEANLDTFPKPARHLLPMHKYKLTASRTQGSRYCPTVIVARGCPFACSYCSHAFGRTFRRHSTERIVEELRELKEQHNVKQVNIEADTLTINKKFVHELCRGMIDADLGLIWTCESRVDTIDEEMLGIMKKAGCWQMSLGVETGSQRLLDSIEKGLTKEKIRKAVHLARNAGIGIRGFFMLGLPSETIAESMETINFAKELDPEWAQFTVTIPFPGTPMYEQLVRQNKMRHFRWSQYNTWGGWADNNLPFIEDGRSEREIKSLQAKAMRLFYLRPKVFWRFLKSVTTVDDLRKYTGGLIVLILTGIESLMTNFHPKRIFTRRKTKHADIVFRPQ